MSVTNPIYPTERIVSPDALKCILGSYGLSISSLERLSEGWDFVVYRMNRTHILRVPKRRQVAARARDEVTFLNAIRQCTAVSIPNYDIVIETEEANGLLFGYPFLEGSPLAAVLKEGELDRVVQPLIALLSTVHELGSPNDVIISSHTDVLQTREKATDVFANLSPLLNRRQRGTISSALAGQVTLDGMRVPIHNDLRPDHILVGVSGIAVIDWTDIAWGYPWEDFLHLWICYGDGIFRSAKEHYCGWQDYWIGNIRTAGTWKAVLEWDYAVQTNDALKSTIVEQFLRRCSLGAGL